MRTRAPTGAYSNRRRLHAEESPPPFDVGESPLPMSDREAENVGALVRHLSRLLHPKISDVLAHAVHHKVNRAFVILTLKLSRLDQSPIGS